MLTNDTKEASYKAPLTRKTRLNTSVAKAEGQVVKTFGFGRILRSLVDHCKYQLFCMKFKKHSEYQMPQEDRFGSNLISDKDLYLILCYI